MGIYDREYVRVGPRSSSGLGGLRFISFNTWLIILNTAVFLLNNVALNRPELLVSVPIGTEWAPEVRQLPSDQRKAVEQNAVVDRSRPAFDQNRGIYYYYIYLQTPAGVQRVGAQIWLEPKPALTAFGHFSTAKVLYGLEVWRFVTFQFLHFDFWHLFFNMFGLWVFGGMVEQYLGARRYAAFYLLCGICGGIAYLVLNMLGAQFGLRLPGVLFNEIFTPLVGASAGVFGVIVAAAFIAPQAIVIIPIIPIPLPLWIFAYGYVIMALVNLLSGGPNAGGDAAHLGGAVGGYFFIRRTHLLRDFFDFLGKRPAPAASSTGHDQHEVDRILAKVREYGLASLDADEKDALRRHSEWLRTRP